MFLYSLLGKIVQTSAMDIFLNLPVPLILKTVLCGMENIGYENSFIIVVEIDSIGKSADKYSPDIIESDGEMFWMNCNS